MRNKYVKSLNTKAMVKNFNPKKLSGCEVFYNLVAVLFYYAPEFADRYYLLKPLVSVVMNDVKAYVTKDPAARSEMMVFYEYLSFRAVMYYRIAHSLLNSPCVTEDEQAAVERASRRISEAAKVISGVEIHPRAKIGDSFVVDHGLGVVIGETSLIGNDVTLLNGVVLGAKKASGNLNVKRHPTVGNNVQIGGDAKIFGNVTIGDNTIIGARAIITTDLPPNTKVILKSNLQILKLENFKCNTSCGNV